VKEKNYNTICPKCKHVFTGYKNVFGKICIYCKTYISPIVEHEMPVISDNKKKERELLKRLYEYLHRKMNEEK